MIKLRKRGGSYCADFSAKNQRIRGPLGVRRLSEAERLVKLLEEAISEGRSSTIWSELQGRIPAHTLLCFSEFIGVTPQHIPTWEELVAAFRSETEQRMALGAMSASTSERYGVTIREFGEFLNGAGISELRQIDKPLVERFKVWRVARIKRKKFARGATGMVLDAAILHRIFSFAVATDMVLKNPVRMEGRPGENPSGGAEPFSAEQLRKMRASAGPDLLTFLLLRWTGFRGGDAANIAWAEIHLDRKEIERVTQKRKKKVILPITSELLFALEAEFQRRKPQPTHPVLVNPETGQKLTRPGPYRRMMALGKRAGVPHSHPHRFRDTLAVDMLCRGASPYDVAKMLGDTIDTVEKHYTPFVKELRERVRNILESGTGLEELSATADATGTRPN